MEGRCHLRIVRRAEHRRRAGVGDVGEERAERDDQAGVHSSGDVEDLLAERPPAKLRLDPPQHDDRRRPRRLGEEELVLGPQDATGPVVVELHHRPHRSEVVELLGVDVDECDGPPRLAEATHRLRGGLAGIVPPLERGDDDRLVQRRVTRPAERTHVLKRYRPGPRFRRPE